MLLAAPCCLLWCCCVSGPLLLQLLIELLLTATNSSAAGFRCLSVAAVALRKNCRSCDTPLFWRCLLAVATVCCLGSLLCCLTVWYQLLYALVYVSYVRILGWSCVLFWFPRVWFIVSSSIIFFLFQRPRRCPCVIRHDGFAFSFYE